MTADINQAVILYFRVYEILFKKSSIFFLAVSEMVFLSDGIT